MQSILTERPAFHDNDVCFPTDLSMEAGQCKDVMYVNAYAFIYIYKIYYKE